MRALVIGAGGFAGRHLTSLLTSEGDEVFSGGQFPKGLASAHNQIVIDITDRASVARALEVSQPDVVYHLAGISFVPEAESDFDKVLKVNVGGTANILSECAQSGRGVSVVFVSSAEVYGAISQADLPITEDTPVAPANNYSLSKRMAEIVVERYQRGANIKASIARPFNHIGPGQDKRFVSASFALQLALIAHGKAPPVMMVGNLEAKRDFSDVRDIVRGYMLIGRSNGGIFNLGSGRSRAVQEVLDTLIEISGLDVKIESDPARQRGPETPELYGSCERIKSLCGWEPEISFERSLEDVYRYWFDFVAQDRPLSAATS
jgi:GDP-4-dehydro-6-deoxy-D-mannose reductase